MSRAGPGRSALAALGRGVRGLAHGLMAVTALAAMIGVWRQRREAQAVRRGELPPASARAEVPLLGNEDALAAAVAGWLPTPPSTPGGRLLVAAWAGPLTAFGLLLAAVSGRTAVWSERWHCFVVEDVGGVSALALRSVGAEANTIGQVVLTRRPAMTEALLAHEAMHVRQAERLGPLMLPAYVLLAARYGYRDHPLERAARTSAARATALTHPPQPPAPSPPQPPR